MCSGSRVVVLYSIKHPSERDHYHMNGISYTCCFQPSLAWPGSIMYIPILIKRGVPAWLSNKQGCGATDKMWPPTGYQLHIGQAS